MTVRAKQLQMLMEVAEKRVGKSSLLLEYRTKFEAEMPIIVKKISMGMTNRLVAVNPYIQIKRPQKHPRRLHINKAYLMPIFLCRNPPKRKASVSAAPNEYPLENLSPGRYLIM